MKLIVFGATGTVGQHLVEQGLQKGYSITAFTRSPQKLLAGSATDLKIFTGDILNARDVELAIQGHDAVLCTIGDGRRGTVRAGGTKNIIEAMRRTNVKRLICQTTLGLGESEANLNFFWRHIMFGWFLKKAFHDHELQEKYVTESNLDYTIVRPSAFANGEITHKYNVAFNGNTKGLKLKISRADVADFMLRQLQSREFIKKAVSISN